MSSERPIPLNAAQHQVIREAGFDNGNFWGSPTATEEWLYRFARRLLGAASLAPVAPTKPQRVVPFVKAPAETVVMSRHGGNVGDTPFYLYPWQLDPEHDQGHSVIVWYDDLVLKQEDLDKARLAAPSRVAPPSGAQTCDCNGGDQGDGLSALPHEPHCATAASPLPRAQAPLTRNGPCECYESSNPFNADAPCRRCCLPLLAHTCAHCGRGPSSSPLPRATEPVLAEAREELLSQLGPLAPLAPVAEELLRLMALNHARSTEPENCQECGIEPCAYHALQGWYRVSDLDAFIQCRIEAELTARASSAPQPEEKFAFNNGSGMTEVMTAEEMIAEIQRLGKRCEELYRASSAPPVVSQEPLRAALVELQSAAWSRSWKRVKAARKAVEAITGFSVSGPMVHSQEAPASGPSDEKESR